MGQLKVCGRTFVLFYPNPFVPLGFIYRKISGIFLSFSKGDRNGH
jgi:hypothetical protein